MFIDIACTQEKKHNQNTSGDYFLSKRIPEYERIIAVLSDGLGSGIKANVLSCMTATMLLRFIEEEINITKAAEIIMNALPVCQVRKISYATFSAIVCDDEGNAKIVEDGNPEFIWLRGREVLPSPFVTSESKKFKNRKLRIHQLKLQLGDRLIFCSDGVTQAGLGNSCYRLGLRRQGLIEALQEPLIVEPKLASSDLTQYIIKKALSIEPDHKPQDDISACVLYCREPRKALVFTGPPYYQQRDHEHALRFANFSGKKAICGGTTADLLARELQRPIVTANSVSMGGLPACSKMAGVDLVTEGILTLTKALEYLEVSNYNADNAAAYLVRFLLASDVITFMVGAKINQAHYDPALPVEIEIRKSIIKKLAVVLEARFYKKVHVEFM